MEKQRKEHKGLKVLRFIGLVFLVMIAAGVALYLYADNKADIVKGYNREIDTGGPLEAKYLQDGPYAAKRPQPRLRTPSKNTRSIILKRWNPPGKPIPCSSL